MLALPSLRVFAVLAAVTPVSACQGLIPNDPDSVLEPLRTAQRTPVASSQRVDEGGYPMFGFAPKAAAPQLSDAEVRAMSTDLNSEARSRKASATDASYRREVARMNALRRQQSAEVNAAMTRKPTGQAQSTTNPTDDVLRQIESGQ